MLFIRDLTVPLYQFKAIDQKIKLIELAIQVKGTLEALNVQEFNSNVLLRVIIFLKESLQSNVFAETITAYPQVEC